MTEKILTRCPYCETFFPQEDENILVCQTCSDSFNRDMSLFSLMDEIRRLDAYPTDMLTERLPVLKEAEHALGLLLARVEK